MKTNILRTVCALATLSAGAALASTSSYEAPLSDDDQLSLTCIDVDFGYMTDLGDGLSVDSLYGVILSTGYTYAATSTSHQKLTFSVGLLYGTDSFNTPEPRTQFTTWFPSAQKNTQLVVPVMLGYSYHHKIIGELSGYVGARAGMYISKSEMKYVDIVVNDPDYPWGGEKGAYYHTKVSPVVGVGVGLEYNITSNMKWNLGVKFDFCHSMLEELPRHIQYVSHHETQEADVITTTIHTGFSYSF